MNLIFIVLIFSFIGVGLEVFWTSIIDYVKTRNPRLEGKSYFWVFFVYGIVPFVYLIVLNWFGSTSIFVRGILYMILFYLLEFISGYTLKIIFGVSPWNYSGYKINLFGKKIKSDFLGVICLNYLPVWYIYGILGEFLFKFFLKI